MKQILLIHGLSFLHRMEDTQSFMHPRPQQWGWGKLRAQSWHIMDYCCHISITAALLLEEYAPCCPFAFLLLSPSPVSFSSFAPNLLEMYILALLQSSSTTFPEPSVVINLIKQRGCSDRALWAASGMLQDPASGCIGTFPTLFVPTAWRRMLSLWIISSPDPIIQAEQFSSSKPIARCNLGATGDYLLKTSFYMS